MPPVRMTDARWVVIVLRRLESDGIETDPILKQAQLTRRQVSDPDGKIPHGKQAVFLTLAAEALGDECLALHLAEKLDPRQSGALGYVLLNSATLRDALKNWRRYLRVLTEAWDIDFERDGQDVAIVGHLLEPLGVYERQTAEGALSLTLHYCEMITGKKITPKRVEFRHVQPKEAKVVQRRFGCPVRYEQNRAALVLDRAILNHPVEAADNELFKILKSSCHQIIEERPRTKDLAFEVKEVIAQLLPSAQVSMADVARKFGMSSRTLRRRLSDEGLIYRKLVDEVRHKLALKYVSDDRINFKQITYLLGYSDMAGFIHAFRRWTGESPSDYRRKIK